MFICSSFGSLPLDNKRFTSNMYASSCFSYVNSIRVCDGSTIGNMIISIIIRNHQIMLDSGSLMTT
jgi:hypothetical protein